MSNLSWLSKEGKREYTARFRHLPARYRKTQRGSWGSSYEIEEIRSGAIIPEPNRPGCYSLDVNTAHGLRRFQHAIEIGDKDPQSEEIEIDLLQAYRFALMFCCVNWKPLRNPKTVSVFSTLPQTTCHRSAQPPSIVSGVDLEETDELTSEGILHQLQSESIHQEEKRRLVIEAEAMDFDAQQLDPLNSILRDFIADYRASNNPNDLVAVNAAIRKCIAGMSVDVALNYAATLLEAGPRAPIPPEIELELAKMVVRKLTANPLQFADYPAELADRLLELVDTYMNPRLLPREKHGAIALNAVLGLVLLRSRHIPDVLRRVSDLNVPWFRQLLARRASRLCHELRSRFPDERIKELMVLLGELEVQAVSMRS